MMKKTLLIAIAAILGTLATGCTKEQAYGTMEATIVGDQYQTKSMLSDATTHLSWQVLQNGTVVANGTQENTDADYGNITADLPVGSYTLVVFANGGQLPTMNTDGTFTFAKVGNGFANYADFTITRAERTQVSMQITRRVAKLHWASTDQVPSNVSKWQVILTSPCTKYNVITATGSIPAVYTSSVLTLNANTDGTYSNYSFALLPSTTQTTMDMELKFYDASNTLLYDRNYQNVPVQTNYVTNLTAPMFHENGNDAAITIDTTWGGNIPWDI